MEKFITTYVRFLWDSVYQKLLKSVYFDRAEIDNFPGPVYFWE